MKVKDELHGAAFVATTRLSTLKDETLAEAGETCERVPASSLPWLLEQGQITPVTPEPARQDARVKGA